MSGINGTLILALFASAAAAGALWRVTAAVRAGLDARRHGWPRLACVGWGVTVMLFPARYWRQARLGRMRSDEAKHWLAAWVKAHGLTGVAHLRCPLCDTELVNALTVTNAGRLVVRPGTQCPRCDFRLDACRHCRNFLPAEGVAGQLDMTHGRCQVYRAAQPVEVAYPRMARRLAAMGYDTLTAPKAITDSYIPLDECNRFEPAMARLRQNRVSGLGRERIAVIRLWQRYLVEGGEDRPTGLVGEGNHFVGPA